MASIRTVTVGFQGPNRNIERVTIQIPADWVTGERDALVEIENNERLRTRLAVRHGAALWAEIGEPWEPTGGVYVL